MAVVVLRKKQEVRRIFLWKRDTAMALKLQTRFRSYAARRAVVMLLTINHFEKEHEAAMRIQGAVRTRQGRGIMYALRKM
jgi:hypothetical protein